jgi:hypothetical protein
MNLKTTLIAVGATLSLAGLGVASAATNATPAHATAATCDSLVKQANTATAAHAAGKKTEAAKKLRAEGEKNCKDGLYDKGAKELRQAITDMGMKPVN